jgi:hypothetical protein
MHLRKLNNKVNANDVPLIFWSLQGVKLFVRSMVLQLGPVAKVAGFDIESDVQLH